MLLPAAACVTMEGQYVAAPAKLKQLKYEGGKKGGDKENLVVIHLRV
jgi:hypothetical protein